MNAGHQEVSACGQKSDRRQLQAEVCYLRQRRALCRCQISRRSSSSHVCRRDEVCCALRRVPPPQHLKEAPRSIRHVVS